MGSEMERAGVDKTGRSQSKQITQTMPTIYEYILKLNAKLDGLTAANKSLQKTDELAEKAQKSVSGLGGKLKTAFNSIPGADFITNPIVAAGAALVATGKMAMSFDESMAKVNTTAQLTPDALKKLKNDLIDMGTSAGADLAKVPDAFEKILSQTGDVILSTDILQASLKGAKAGFTEQSVVASALAQTLSLVGKENTNAQEVLDTMFAAKRVGAGEFKDFANYIPGLIASGQSLGLGFKETAGLFAFMTGKGQSAERSATLIENAFTALGKSDITKGLQAAGVTVFNKDGSLKEMDAIFGNLQKKLQAFGTDDKAKSNFLESIGLRDQQAKQAFMILSSDGAKLKEVLGDVSNAAGETKAAFDLSANPMQTISKLWAQIQKVALSFGGVISAVLIPVFTGVLFVLTPVVDAFSWLFDRINEGNPYILTLIGTIAAYTIIANGASIASGLVAAKTWLWTAAQTALNFVMSMNPIGLVIIGIGLLIGAIIYAYQKFGWFRGAVLGAWEAIKGFGLMMKEYVIDRLKGLLSGISGIGKALIHLFNGDFKAAWQTAKAAGADIIGVDARNNAVKNAALIGKNIGAAYKQGVAEVVQNTAEQKGIAPVKVPGTVAGATSGTDTVTAPIKSGTETVASGGTRNSTTIINMDKFFDNIIFQGGLKDNADDVKRKIEEMFAQILYAAQSAS